MATWPDRRALDLFGIDLPILQAPMAGAGGAELAIAVAEAGGLGALPCAQLAIDAMRSSVLAIRAATSKPLNVNFFCHTPPAFDETREAEWRAALKPYYMELGIDPKTTTPAASRSPFDGAYCELVEELRPEVVSFHFGMPGNALVRRVKDAGAKVISSATTVDEATWLEENGCDAIIAQGAEAGGHRGMFLSSDVSTQIGLFALLPQVVDAVKVPVIAAGGIADARGIVAAFALGASAVQLGTAYLFCPESTIGAAHRQALGTSKSDRTAITNVFTGKPARGIVNRIVRELGPISQRTPVFPLASGALAPLRAKAEASGSGDFTSQWSGQAARLGREMPAGELTRKLAAEALAKL